jgi:adenine-specific DNA-methyltransferase
MRPALALPVKTKKPFGDILTDFLPANEEISTLLLDKDPHKAISSGKLMTKVFFKSLKDHPDHISYSHSFVYQVIHSLWKNQEFTGKLKSLPLLSLQTDLIPLDASLASLAEALGHAFAKLELDECSYQLGNLYTGILPESLRSSNGIYYTPPSLTNRLLDMIEETGIDWETAKVIDPACGGGAFLIPVISRILKRLKKKTSLEKIYHIETHLTGYDIDPFGAWLSQVFVEVVLKDMMNDAGIRIQRIIKVTDTLNIDSDRKFDVVLGNPPYGKTRLNINIREKYKESLFGHANLYGLFTHAAINMVAEGGTIGYLTPTSFLSGEYFKNLRQLLRKRTTPVAMDFVLCRKGVFEDVLQETILSTYIKRNNSDQKIRVNGVHPISNHQAELTSIGTFELPNSLSDPWILARQPGQSKLVYAMSKMKHLLNDWGFKVSTGPLVWNRHKTQLTNKHRDCSYPIIWAESITADGRFAWKTEKKNHAPYLNSKEGDTWLITHQPCILLQRTTAKEQHKRLIAASLPMEFIQKYGGVIVENHLNMILPLTKTTAVDPSVLSAFLNSKVVNDAFRAVSGSVAVSAYELESLPLPHPKMLKRLKELLDKNSSQEAIEIECFNLYS